MKMPPIRLLEVHGSHYEMGYQHGQAYAADIRELTEERTHLSMDGAWVGRTATHDQVMAVADACLDHHYAYAPAIMREIEGMAAATGLSVRDLVIANGFTDFVDAVYNLDDERVEPDLVATNCTAFMTGRAATAEGWNLIGQTWDMHATATPYVILLKGTPDDGPAFMTFTVTGCVGMIGMNAHGIAVCINNLMDSSGKPGVTWPFVIRKLLMQDNIEDALACITQAPLAGGHNYMLADAEGNAYNIEAMSTAVHVEPLTGDALAHANRCLAPATQAVERGQTEDLQLDSDTRLGRAITLLQDHPVTPQVMMDITRDRSDGAYSVCALSEPPFYSETCGAAIMRPSTREFWGVWGLPKDNEYERFVLV